MKKYLDLFFHS